MLLARKTRAAIEALVKQGVPPVTAGMIYGIPKDKMLGFIRNGMSEAPNTAPPDPKKMILTDNKWVKYTAGELHQHDLECRALARCICKSEGTLVSKLARKLWGLSTGKFCDAATARFMFKQYTHAHGISAPSDKAASGEEDPDKDPEENVQIILPDNGRLVKV